MVSIKFVTACIEHKSTYMKTRVNVGVRNVGTRKHYVPRHESGVNIQGICSFIHSSLVHFFGQNYLESRRLR